MTATPETQNFLDKYTTERLPRLVMGGLEDPGDDLSFTTDTRYQQLLDPVGQSSAVPT